MSRLLSDRAAKTSDVVVLPATLEDPKRTPAGVYRVSLLAICGSIFAFFAALVIAYWWRSQTPPFWDPIPLPGALWVSTALMLASSATFETGRRVFRQGGYRRAMQWLTVTAGLGVAFLISQLTAWRALVRFGAFLAANPHSTFFYLFTGLHGLHLIGGLVALLVLFLRRSVRRELVDSITYYWHFLGLLWIALFSVLGLIS
jgi:cytochrome c oxidase subunit III